MKKNFIKTFITPVEAFKSFIQVEIVSLLEKNLSSRVKGKQIIG